MTLLIKIALADAGLARWELSWSGPARLTYDSDFGDRLTQATGVADAGLSLDWRPATGISYPHPSAVR